MPGRHAARTASFRIAISSALVLLLATAAAGGGREATAARPLMSLPRVERAPTLEDFLDMRPSPGIAGQMAKAGEFTQRDPSDGDPPTQRTEAYLGYDNRYLYVVFVAFDSEPEKIRARMTRREDAFDDDFVEVTLDT